MKDNTHQDKKAVDLFLTPIIHYKKLRNKKKSLTSFFIVFTLFENDTIQLIFSRL